MMSMGRTEGQEEDWVRGYMWVYQLTASLSRPLSRGSTKCLGVPAHDAHMPPLTDRHTQISFVTRNMQDRLQCSSCHSHAQGTSSDVGNATMQTSRCSFRGMIENYVSVRANRSESHLAGREPSACAPARGHSTLTLPGGRCAVLSRCGRGPSQTTCNPPTAHILSPFTTP